MGMGKANKNSKTTLATVPTCARCTALIRAGLQRCGMCSWPVNVAFPQTSGELETVDAASPEPELAEVVGAQLDALGRMPAELGAMPAEPAYATETTQQLTATAVDLDPLTAPIEQL